MELTHIHLDAQNNRHIGIRVSINIPPKLMLSYLTGLSLSSFNSIWFRAGMIQPVLQQLQFGLCLRMDFLTSEHVITLDLIGRKNNPWEGRNKQEAFSQLDRPKITWSDIFYSCIHTRVFNRKEQLLNRPFKM